MRIEKSIDIEVDIDDFDTDELIEALGDKDLTDDDRKELLRYRVTTTSTSSEKSLKVATAAH